jgi:excisionase family DNA binding protein
MNAPQLYTVERVAELLKLHVKTERAYVRSGRLKGTRIGKQYRITRRDLEEFAGTSAIDPPAVNRTRHVVASVVVDADAVKPETADRISTLVIVRPECPRRRRGRSARGHHLLPGTRQTARHDHSESRHSGRTDASGEHAPGGLTHDGIWLDGAGHMLPPQTTRLPIFWHVSGRRTGRARNVEHLRSVRPPWISI